MLNENNNEGDTHMAGKYEIYKDRRGEFRFRLKSSNGQNILASEGYKSKAGAQNGIASVRKNASKKGNFHGSETKNGKYCFVLKAANHQVIGTSQTYNTKTAMENGIKSVQTNAKCKTVES